MSDQSKTPEWENTPAIGVIGGARCSEKISKLAQETGREIARQGAMLVCGGLSGVMEASCRGAKQSEGVTIGILPGTSKYDANPFVDIKIVTGLGHARNVLIVQTSDALIAIDGSYGTLSEAAFGLIYRKPVIGLKFKFEIEGVIPAQTPAEAVKLAIELLGRI